MKTQSLDISDLRDRLDEVFSSVASGAEVLIEKDEKPFARVSPVTPVPVLPKERTPGLARGKIRIGPDFDDPLFR